MKVTSSFGMRIHPLSGRVNFHNGIDLAAAHDLVFNIFNGTVLEVSYSLFFGNYIRISYQNLVCSYGHLSRVLVSKGQHVFGGQIIGISGNSGRVTGPHLHLSIALNGVYINPLQFLLQSTRQPAYAQSY